MESTIIVDINCLTIPKNSIKLKAKSMSLKIFMSLTFIIQFQLIFLILWLLQYDRAAGNEIRIEQINNKTFTTMINTRNFTNENVNKQTNNITLLIKMEKTRELKKKYRIARFYETMDNVNKVYNSYKRLKRSKKAQQLLQQEQQQQQQQEQQQQLNHSNMIKPSSLRRSMNFTIPTSFKIYNHYNHHHSLMVTAEEKPHHFSKLDGNLSRRSAEKLLAQNCGGIRKSQYGIIQTPNFPYKFITPLECIWIIDASDFVMPPSQNVTIFIYLSQLYVLSGLQFTEYMYYTDDFKVPAHRVFTLNEDDVTQLSWIQFNSPYLEIRFQIATLDGTHLRALDQLLDVYGFNFTYEVTSNVKSYQCNTLQCRFLGHCFAQADFSSYYCSCFAGFSGVDCGYGPLCNDPYTNVCQNGGTCNYIFQCCVHEIIQIFGKE